MRVGYRGVFGARHRAADLVVVEGVEVNMPTTPIMKLKRLLDLAGTDVAGLTVDIDTRNADGSLRYTSRQKPRMRVLKSVSVEEKKDSRGVLHEWLYWRWEPDRGELGDCGYSGARMDLDDLGEYWLMIEEK